MDKEKIICLMHTAYELSVAIATMQEKVNKMSDELHKTLQVVFQEYEKDKENKTPTLSARRH